mmetsp:Transcript_21261/g.32705  ORF Transcript_21261/g.32705 Transcript_21261/m.32705 type:complete len:486 (+) Transcript_21261:122-1579(+)
MNWKRVNMIRRIRSVGYVFAVGFLLTQYTANFPSISKIPAFSPKASKLEEGENKIREQQRRLETSGSSVAIESGKNNGFQHRALRGGKRYLIQKLKLRCAVFGNVDAYGSMQFQHGDRESSFAYQICDSMKNYAYASRGTNYASTCLQSLVDETEVFDLIILDFDGKPTDDLKLAARLNERFPNAQFLILDRFQPNKVVFKPEGKDQMDYTNFRRLYGFKKHPDEFDTDEFKTILAKLEKQKGKLFYYRNSRKYTINSLVASYNAIPITWGDEENIERSLIDTVELHNDDGTMLNQAGHDFLASKIIEVARKANVSRTSVIDLGTWGQGDVCHTWYDSGELSLSTGTLVEYVAFAKNRHGLQFPSEGEWVHVLNPFSESRTLYLSYVVSPGSERIHSRAKIVVESPGSDINTLVDTVAFDKLTNLVTPRTIPVGSLPPGSHYVWVHPENDAPEPFYLTGLTIAANQYKPHEYGFLSSYWISEGGV